MFSALQDLTDVLKKCKNEEFLLIFMRSGDMQHGGTGKAESVAEE